MINRMSTAVALSTLFTFAAPGTASAALFDFAYTSPLMGGTFTGRIDGTLQADNNTVFVNSVETVFFDGSPVPVAFNIIGAAEPFINGSGFGGTGVISIDGSVMDIIGCADPSCAAPFGGIAPANVLGPGIVAFGVQPPTLFEAFDPQNWNLAPVPTPGALVLFASAGFGLFSARRRNTEAART